MLFRLSIGIFFKYSNWERSIVFFYCESVVVLNLSLYLLFSYCSQLIVNHRGRSYCDVFLHCDLSRWARFCYDFFCHDRNILFVIDFINDRWLLLMAILWNIRFNNCGEIIGKSRRLAVIHKLWSFKAMCIFMSLVNQSRKL